MTIMKVQNADHQCRKAKNTAHQVNFKRDCNESDLVTFYF